MAPDYAVLHEREHDGRVQLNFTELGQAVFDALMDAAPDDRLGDDTEFESVEARMLDLIHRYPTNPWAHAVYVCSFGHYYFQGDWAQGLAIHREPGRGYRDLDADPGFAKHSKANAAQFLEHARTAVHLFDELLEGKGDRHIEHNLTTTRSDPFYYPAVLYFGAYVAANAGEEKLAISWAKRNLKLVDQDNFGSRYLLSALYLNEGRASSSIKKLFAPKNMEG